MPVGAGALQPPPEAAQAAFLLASATAELARAKHAPLCADGAAGARCARSRTWARMIALRLPARPCRTPAPPAPRPSAAAACPLLGPLTYLQSVEPKSADAAWCGAQQPAPALPCLPTFAPRPLFTVPAPADSPSPPRPPRYGLLADRAFDAYLDRLRSQADRSAAAAAPAPLDAQPHAAGSLSGGPGGVSELSEWERSLVALGCVLIRHLGASGGHEDGAAPLDSAAADRLLRRLLAAYSPLYWSYDCMAALLSAWPPARPARPAQPGPRPPASSSAVGTPTRAHKPTSTRTLGRAARAPARGLVTWRLVTWRLVTWRLVTWRPCARPLAGELEAEEGVDHPLGAASAAAPLNLSAGAPVWAQAAAAAGGDAGAGVLWRWLRSWVSAAASAAPGRTEALLHQFLGQVGTQGGGGGCMRVRPVEGETCATRALQRSG